MRTIRWLLSLTWCLYLLVSLPACSTPPPVMIDPSHGTPFADGWGTSLSWWANEIGGWPSGERQKIITMLFAPPPAGLGLTIARYNIGAGAQMASNCPPLRLGAQIPTFEPQPGVWTPTADGNQVRVLQEAKQAGANLFEAFATSPPAWMTVSGCTSGNPQITPSPQITPNPQPGPNPYDEYNNLKTGYISLYVNYLQRVITQLAAQGITFRTLEPFNEANPQDGGFVWPPPDCKSHGTCQEGANFSPELEVRVLNALCDSLRGTGITVSAPDENSIDTTLATYQKYQPLPPCLTQINTHSYNGSERQQLQRLAQDNQKRLWMSEYTPLDHNPLTLAKQIATDLNGMHPAAWIYWQAVESFEQGGGFGLLQAPYCSPNSDPTIESLNRSFKDSSKAGSPPLCRQTSNAPQVGTPTEQYSVMANYSMFIRPGDSLLDVPNNDSSHLGSSHLIEALNPTTQTLVLVATNDQGRAVPVTFDVSRFTQADGPVQVYTTTEKKQVSLKNWSSTATLRNQQLSTNLEANSVTTFVIKRAVTRSLVSTRATTRPSVPENPLGKVDWTKVVTETDLGCNDTTPGHIGPHLGVEVDEKQFADITGDGKKDAFVAVSCVGSTESWPDRLEVFDGASDPAHPRRIATLLDYQDGTDGPDGYGLRIQSIKVSGKHVIVVSKGWLAGECFACGDQQVTDTFTWNGSGFTRGSRSVIRAKGP